MRPNLPALYKAARGTPFGSARTWRSDGANFWRAVPPCGSRLRPSCGRRVPPRSMSATASPCTASPSIPSRRRCLGLRQSRRAEGRQRPVRHAGHLRFAASLHPQGRAGRRHQPALGDAVLAVARRGLHRLRPDRRDDRGPEDRSWVAFTLRPQAKWHDGTPITVDDVIWTFETLKAKGPPMYASYYADVLKAEKTGDRKVQFTFRRHREPRAAADPRPVAGRCRRNGGRARDFEKVLARGRAGSGAYKVDSFDVGRSISLSPRAGLVGQGPLDEPRPQQLRRHALRVLSRRRP